MLASVTTPAFRGMGYCTLPRNPGTVSRQEMGTPLRNLDGSSTEESASAGQVLTSSLGK